MNSNKNKLNILAIPPSLRKASVMRHLLRTLQPIAPDGMEITVFDLHDKGGM